MNIKILLTAIGLVAFSASHAQIVNNNLKAQAPAATSVRIPIQIQQIDLVQDSMPVSGNGHKGYYHAIITSVGAGTVSYEWILRGNVGPGGNPPPPSVISGTLTLNGTGTDHVYHTVGIGSHGLTTIQFKTTAPVVALSPTRSY